MLTEWLDYISAVSILMPFIISISQFSRLNTELKFLAYFFSFATAIEIIAFTMSIYRLNNLWLMNIYTLIEGVVFFWLLGKWFESKTMFVVIITLLALYVGYWCYTTFLQEGILIFNSKEMTVKAIFLIFLSGYLLIKLSMKDEINLLNNYIFWISAGILIYFLVSLVVFSSADFMITDKFSAMHYTWTIHSIINILANLLFFYAFLCYRKNNSYISPQSLQ